MEAALAGTRGVLVVCFLLSAVWLSSLPGVRRCGGRHGPGSRLGLLGLFVLGVCFWVLIAEMIKERRRALFLCVFVDYSNEICRGGGVQQELYYFRYIYSNGRKTRLTENGVSPEPNLCWCKLNTLH